MSESIEAGRKSLKTIIIVSIILTCFITFIACIQNGIHSIFFIMFSTITVLLVVLFLFMIKGYKFASITISLLFIFVSLFNIRTFILTAFSPFGLVIDMITILQITYAIVFGIYAYKVVFDNQIKNYIRYKAQRKDEYSHENYR